MSQAQLTLKLGMPQRLSSTPADRTVVVSDAAWIFVVQNHTIRFKIEVPAGSDFTQPVPITVNADASQEDIWLVALPHEDGGDQRLAQKDCASERGGFCQLCMVCYGCCLPPPPP